MYETDQHGHTARRRLALAALCAIALGLGGGCASGAAKRAELAEPVDAVALSATAATPVASAGRASSSRGDPYRQTVRQLASRDFATRSRAARTLVAAGEAALPALGRAGDMPVRVDGGMRVSATRAVVRAVVGEAEDPVLLEHLGSPWGNVRREAATEIGRRDRWSAVPRLIDHLEDGDPEVRAASAEALRRVTNHFFGYRAEATVAQRRRSADRWRTWWTVEGRSRARAERAQAGGTRKGADGS